MIAFTTLSPHTEPICLKLFPVLGLVLLLLPFLAIGQDRELISKARSGDPHAQYELGEHYYQSGSYSRALRMWTMAARSGYAPAQYSLGLLYRDGKGTHKDSVKATEWMTKAADQGHKQARKVLAEGDAAIPTGKKTADPERRTRTNERIRELEEKSKRDKERLAKVAEIRRIEDKYVESNILDKRYSENCTRYYAEAKMREEAVRCLKRANSILEKNIQKREEANKKLETENEKLQAENKKLEARKKKYNEIKRIEDNYVKNSIFDKRYRDNCERYFSEAKLGGERKRCVERAKSITDERINKYKEIKRIEDNYIKNDILDKRYNANCNRYFTEVKLGGEKMRCLERSEAILKKQINTLKK
jgi:TPR repeat protein